MEHEHQMSAGTRWTCSNCNMVNPTFDPWCSACNEPQPAAEPVPVTINSCEIDSKLIVEPAPVAQRISPEILRMDAASFERIGGFSMLSAARILRQAADTIADHARRDDELQYRLDTANAFGEQCMTDIDRLLKEAEALEASLAAYRAESFADRVLSEFHDRTAEIGEVWPPEAHRQRRVGAMHKAISAAIDALRKEAP